MAGAARAGEGYWSSWEQARQLSGLLPLIPLCGSLWASSQHGSLVAAQDSMWAKRNWLHHFLWCGFRNHTASLTWYWNDYNRVMTLPRFKRRLRPHKVMGRVTGFWKSTWYGKECCSHLPRMQSAKEGKTETLLEGGGKVSIPGKVGAVNSCSQAVR